MVRLRLRVPLRVDFEYEYDLALNNNLMILGLNHWLSFFSYHWHASGLGIPVRWPEKVYAGRQVDTSLG